MFKTILLVAQITIPLLLITAILLQQKGTALGSAFGGEGGGFYSKKRGLEKKLNIATIILAGLFLAFSLLNIVIH